MTTQSFPIAYRWFLSKGLSNWEPWYFVDSVESIKSLPDFSRDSVASRAFKLETGAEFDVYLFARRQDRDELAFFVVEDGAIQDKVVTIHLSFSKHMELKTPLQSADIGTTFAKWIQSVVVPDVSDWMSEEDMGN